MLLERVDAHPPPPPLFLRMQNPKKKHSCMKSPRGSGFVRGLCHHGDHECTHPDCSLRQVFPWNLAAWDRVPPPTDDWRRPSESSEPVSGCSGARACDLGLRIYCTSQPDDRDTPGCHLWSGCREGCWLGTGLGLGGAAGPLPYAPSLSHRVPMPGSLSSGLAGRVAPLLAAIAASRTTGWTP